MPVVRQRWETITFIHWSYPTEVVQALLPPPFEVETWDGRAWVGLLPFFMRVYPPIGGPVPRLTTFSETNVRTYVRGPDGRAGIWFFSLDAASAPAVVAARTLYGLPYFLSRMRVRREEGRVRYTARRLSGGAGHDIVVTPQAPLPEQGLDDFDRFLTARFLLWATHLGKVVSVPAEHPPWRLRAAQVERLEQNLVERAGLPTPDSAPILHYSEGVEVRLGRAVSVGRSTS
jgi:uncharacterized protein